MPASLRAGRPYNTDAIALPEPTGDIQITIVVADDITFVEHPGNAERPHAAAHRPIPSLHRPSGWSRSFVLASLRALHLDQRLRPGARAKRALTDGATQVTTGQRRHTSSSTAGPGSAAASSRERNVAGATWSVDMRQHRRGEHAEADELRHHRRHGHVEAAIRGRSVARATTLVEGCGSARRKWYGRSALKRGRENLMSWRNLARAAYDHPFGGDGMRSDVDDLGGRSTCALRHVLGSESGNVAPAFGGPGAVIAVTCSAHLMGRTVWGWLRRGVHPRSDSTVRSWPMCQ